MDQNNGSHPELPEVVVVTTHPNRTKKIIITLVLFCVTILAGIAYWYLSRPAHSPSQATATSKPLAAPKIELQEFAKGLPSPTGIVSTNQPDDNRLFILDRSGVIRIVNVDGKQSSEPFLDISSLVLAKDEMGLLGLAFSPDYKKSGYFFINYIDKQQNTVIARYQVSANADKANPTASQTLLTVKQPYPNHNGGDLLFGNDGYLYTALGDGGSAGDPQNRAQDPTSLFGKILRLDVSQLPYKIPSSNPFVNQTGTRAEIWDLGLRNPWRISFDSKTHELYIADVGQDETEEINVEAAGKGGNNYGWHCYEGNGAYNPSGCKAKDQYVFPAFEYDHNDKRCSVTGGYVYRGSRYPALDGKYFYGDYCNGQIYWTEKQGGQWQPTLAVTAPFKISTFGQDNRGELYVADFEGGTIYRLQDTAN